MATSKSSKRKATRTAKPAARAAARGKSAKTSTARKGAAKAKPARAKARPAKAKPARAKVKPAKAKPARKAGAARAAKSAAVRKVAKPAARGKAPAKPARQAARSKAPAKPARQAARSAPKPSLKPSPKPSPKPPPKRTAGRDGPGAGPAPKRVVNLKDAHLEHIDDRLLRQIVAKLEEMREESRNIVYQNVHSDMMPREESSDVGDDLDQASNERDREFNLIMHQRHLRRLQQIEDAFDRIADGSYGLCEGTDEPINPRRLLIMPLARYSLEYQEQQEKTLGRTLETDGYVEGDDSFSADD